MNSFSPRSISDISIKYNEVSFTAILHYLPPTLFRHMLRTGVNKSKHHELFKHYDQNDNGYVDGEEIAVSKTYL